MTAPAIPDKLPVVPVTPVAVTHLFRHSVREGRVHPLLHIVLRYRLEPPR